MSRRVETRDVKVDMWPCVERNQSVLFMCKKPGHEIIPPAICSPSRGDADDDSTVKEKKTTAFTSSRANSRRRRRDEIGEAREAMLLSVSGLEKVPLIERTDGGAVHPTAECGERQELLQQQQQRRQERPGEQQLLPSLLSPPEAESECGTTDDGHVGFFRSRPTDQRTAGALNRCDKWKHFCA